MIDGDTRPQRLLIFGPGNSRDELGKWNLGG